MKIHFNLDSQTVSCPQRKPHPQVLHKQMADFFLIFFLCGKAGQALLLNLIQPLVPWIPQLPWRLLLQEYAV